MTDYIDRQAAIDVVKHAWAKGLEPSQYIEIISSAEVEPVKRGKWINDKGLYRCSECNELWTHWWANVVPIERMNKMMKYCPNCGAKMKPISASPENGQEVEE